jgi:hypothetical protein
MKNAVYYVLEWRFQETFISHFRLGAILWRLGPQGKKRYTAWMKARA